MRVVFDANVVVSALLSQTSTSRRSFEWSFVRDTVLVTPKILNEYAEVLARPKIRKRVTSEEAAFFLSEIKLLCEVVQVRDPQRFCRDPKDDEYLCIARQEDVDFLITGDLDLLTLDPFGHTRIVTPADFLSLVA